MTEARQSGVDIAPGVEDLRELATELRQRNFAGMLMAYRRLRAFADRLAPPESVGGGIAELAAPVRSGPSE